MLIAGKSVTFQSHRIPIHDQLEYVFVNVMEGLLRLIISAAYFAQLCDMSYYKIHSDVIADLASRYPFPKRAILGDYNFAHIQWINYPLRVHPHPNTHNARRRI